MSGCYSADVAMVRRQSGKQGRIDAIPALKVQKQFFFETLSTVVRLATPLLRLQVSPVSAVTLFSLVSAYATYH